VRSLGNLQESDTRSEIGEDFIESPLNLRF